MGEPTGLVTGLVDVLTAMRSVVARARFPLAVPSGPEAAGTAGRITKQLDDYILPRLDRLDAPLLVIVGGSTGAGKSTLVNSVVQAPVSAAGVLRPTTRGPVLVSNPADVGWFVERRVLPGLTRTNTSRGDHDSLQVISAPALAPGLALLDAPDIDSVVDANREIAARLLAAADLWLFVTTAARYADAVPWQVLRTARERGTVLAIVLDRVPPGAEAQVATHLREMLVSQQLGEVTLFVIPESRVDGAGLLPEPLVAPLRHWLARLALDAAARQAVIRTTLDGAIRSVAGDVDTLALAADEQARAWVALQEAVQSAYTAADTAVEAAMADGVLLRGEVLARWQEFVGTGELMRALRARVGRLRDSIITALIGRPPPGRNLRDALTSAVATLIEAQAIEAGERTAKEWAAMPAGAPLSTPALAQPRPGLRERSERLVRDWQRGVLDLVAAEGANRRRSVQVSAYTINATGLLVTIGVFASTAFIPTGAEVAVAGGTTAGAQRLMKAVFGDEAMRQLAATAREDLIRRVRELLIFESARFGDVRKNLSLDPALPRRLREAAQAVADRRLAAVISSPALLDTASPALTGTASPAPIGTAFPAPVGTTSPGLGTASSALTGTGGRP